MPLEKAQIRGCENLAIAKYIVSESEELLYEAKDEIPDLGCLMKMNDEQA